MRLIDAEAVKDAIAELNENGYDVSPSDLAFVRNILLRMPTIDAVPVVRCRDCKHRKAKMGDCYGNGLVLCNDGVWRDMEFFCADGERSEE